MVTVWGQQTVHYSFQKPGETITALKYCQQFDEVHRKLHEKQPLLVNRNGTIFLHDNARLHMAKVTQTKLNNLGFEVLPHPPYSPNLSLPDFHFFKHFDNFTMNRQSQKHEAVQEAFKVFIKSRTIYFYRQGITDLITRWQKCMQS